MLRAFDDSVADYCRRALSPTRWRSADRVDSTRARWQEMAALGWVGLLVPEARGGSALGLAAYASACRALGRVAAAEPLIECAGIAATLLGAVADDRRLNALLAGDRIHAVSLVAEAWQHHGALTARATADGYLLDGQLAHVALALDADSLLCVAGFEDRCALFEVPARPSAIAWREHVLADGTRVGSANLRALHVASDACIARDIGDTAATAWATAGLGASAYLLGVCEALFECTLEYLTLRRQFGRALASFQALQHRLVDCYRDLRLSAAALRVACAEPVQLVNSARVRHRALSSSQRLVREAIQLHGAMGYTADSEIAPFVQRALVMSARVAGAQEELARAPAIAWGVEAPGAECVPAPRNEAGAPDHDWNTLDDAAFRATVRGWIGANYPDELRYLARQLRWAEIKDWHARLVARGWVAPAWPRAYGGMGLDPAKLLIFIEECERHGVARAPDQGIVMLGPILFEYGTAEQRARWLEPARTGEHIWCQGYSEPNAGSDLAALSTRAEPDGDDFLISGQKTWTTHGLDATHMYCLARTDAAAKPQAGISFFLIDLAQAGVTVRPLENLSGDVDFCAVFLDRVRVPRANLIGELNHGWTIAKSLLGHERLFVGSPKLCQRALSQLRALARARGRVRDPVFVHALTASALEVMDLEALYGEFAALVRGGGTPGADVAILKIHSTEVYVRLSEMILAVAGADAGVRGAQDCGGTAVDVLGHFYNARPAPIYAGSNEIQRNIVAKQVLGLPT